ncbi:MAG TPA: hypothetical protein VHG35_01630 [Gemmatimonadales bacterium]|nr:hypothetical protein [Gemmatimonadales bacterium]
MNDPGALAAAWLALALGAALLPGDRERRLSAAGLLTLGLGLAAWRAGSPPGLTLAAPDQLGEGFLVVNGGLLVLGPILLTLGAALAGPGRLRPAARLVVGLGVALLWWACAGFVAAAGPLRATGAAVALGVAGAGLLAGARALASSSRMLTPGRRLFPPPVEPLRPPLGSVIPVLVLVGSLAAVALGPHVAVVFLGVIGGTWAGYLVARRPAARPVPLAPLLTLALAPAYWLLAMIAGPVGLGRSALGEIPVSPAAELIIAPSLLLAAWATAALWPLHRQLPGALAAPLGALLLARIGLPLTPDGLEHWRPLAVPLLVLGLWHAAAHARWALLAGGAGVLGFAAATEAGASGAAWLLPTGLALELAALRPPRGLVTSTSMRAGAWLAASWGGLRVLEGGLRGEVVYMALGTLGLALIVAARRDSSASPAR